MPCYLTEGQRTLQRPIVREPEPRRDDALFWFLQSNPFAVWKQMVTTQ